MTVRALVVMPDGTAQVRDIEPDSNSLNEIVGGWLEAIYPANSRFGDWHAYVDEEGKLKGLPVNQSATMLAYAAGWAGRDVLVGPVVFLGSAGEGEDEGAEEGDVPPELVSLGWDTIVCS